MTRPFDWPETLARSILFGPMEFGAVASGHVEVLAPAGTGVFQPYYPCVLKLAVPATGDFAEISIPPGSVQPKIGYTTTPKITTASGTPNAVNIFKSGTDLVFEFNMSVPAFVAARVL